MDYAIVILIRNDWRDIVDLNECLASIAKNIPETLSEADFIFYHEAGFEQYRSGLEIPIEFRERILFYEIDLQPPNDLSFNREVEVPEYVPHPTHSNGPIAYGHPGFTLGYRGMCRFFGATIFRRSEIQEYKYIMRLDTDSRFLAGNSESLFSWAESNHIIYGYIRSAIQWDHVKLFKGLKLWSLFYFVKSGKYAAFLKALITRRGRVFYTNFEISQVDFFSSTQWQDYFDFLDKSGGFYTRRWGDHILRYMGVNALVKKKYRKALKPGYKYQHGGVFDTAERQSWRPRWM